MNYLFMFNEYVDLDVLWLFQDFIEELGVVAFCENANVDLTENDAKFPPNFMVIYADTDNESLLETITNKYTRLIKDNPAITIQDKEYGKSALQ
jgi:hypothetical protein